MSKRPIIDKSLRHIRRKILYELLILGVLTSRDMSGYKLRIILESSLVPRREISNGVMYPLLRKLANKGFIEFIEDYHNPRNKKMAHITSAGIERFRQLMNDTVSRDAKRESIFRFKFRGMAGVDSTTQNQILDDFEAAEHSDLKVYQEVLHHLHAKLDDPTANHPYIIWAIRSLNLSLSICRAKIKWIKNCRQKINEDRKRLNGQTK
ncbi:PadR family transcriptional regulator [Lentilactobacillus hilgardii]|nr:PadR family transcriptional regulator [Lentilactobacillus hilgardii]MCP9349321.1 PadR family transcriptional regulator [Lentilactobacillus hilgardii]MCP9352189.1 PadR family transcriptional regulator [Lentilactobacillus hilgardii]